MDETRFVILAVRQRDVLLRVLQVFAAVNVSISALAAGEAEGREMMRIEVVAAGGTRDADHLRRRLHQLVPVIRVMASSADNGTTRMVQVLRVAACSRTRREVMDIAGGRGSTVLEVNPRDVLLETVGTVSELGALAEDLATYGVVSLTRFPSPATVHLRTHRQTSSSPGVAR